MKQRRYAGLVTLVVSVAIGGGMTQEICAARKPNVVLVNADDLGYGDLGCYGATRVRTPNIDRLAAEGRRFTDAHSASAVCSPSRYALLTGRYPFRKADLWGPVMLKSPLVVDPDRLTLGRLMKEAGYATACIGKWHLGFGKKHPTDWNRPLKPGPLELGFDYYFGVPVVNSHPPFVYVENHHVVGLTPDDPMVYGKKAATRVHPEKMGLDVIGGAEAAHALYDDEKVGATLTEKAVGWIRKQKDGPFFLYLATPHIHHPFTPAPRFDGDSGCGRYGDFIHELDWVVGEVMAVLDEIGVADNTLVVFTGDNGGMINQGGQDAWKAGHRMNGDLLGFKFDAWEGGHRVPFIARWPGRIPAGTTSDQLVCNVDMLATLASAVGRTLEGDEGPDSIDILPALTGTPEAALRDHLVLCPRRKQNIAVRKGKWMYIAARGNGGWDGSRVGEHLFGGAGAHLFTGQVNSDVENGKFRDDAPPAQLYDLEADPSQAKNLYREHPEIVEEMKALLAEERRGLGRQRPQSFEKELRVTVRTNYLLYLPKGYEETVERWPLVLFLHGAGERGDDLDLVAKHGPPKLAARGKDFPFIIVSPQCPAEGWWASHVQVDTLAALLDDVVARYRVDESRIYLTGLSMGGFGTWSLAVALPDRFAAIAPICGGGVPFETRRIAHVPAWVFHGANDQVVPPAKSEEMVEALKKAGGNVKFTVYPEAGHDSWTETYNNPEFYEWLLRQRR